MSLLAGENGFISGSMDACSEPIDPSESDVQLEMIRISDLSSEDRQVEYCDIARTCFELCGAENIVRFDQDVARQQCYAVRITRAALIASDVILDIREDFEELIA